MSKDNLDTGRNTDSKFVETEEEREKRLDREESARKLKAIVGFAYGLLHFEKLEKMAGNYPQPNVKLAAKAG